MWNWKNFHDTQRKVDRRKLPGVGSDDLVRDDLGGCAQARSDRYQGQFLQPWWRFDKVDPDRIAVETAWYTLKIRHILQVPVLGDLARYLEPDTRRIDQSAVEGTVELTPIQRYFFETPIFKGHHHYNQSVLLRSEQDLDPDALARSIDYLTAHHDALRIIYKREGDGWLQYNAGVYADPVPIVFYDLRDPGWIKTDGSFGARAPIGFQLESGPLLKAGHFKLKDGDRLALIVHHLVVDGVSWRILLEDLSTLYAHAYRRRIGASVEDGFLPAWAALQKRTPYGTFQAERSYWEQVSAQSTEEFPRDKAGSGQVVKIHDSVSFTLNKTITERLQTEVHGGYLWGGQKCCTDGGHGREEIIEDVDIGRTVGCSPRLPVRTGYGGHDDALSNLVEVKEGLRRVPNKGIGYGMHRYLSDDPIPGTGAPIEFNYLGDFGDNVGDGSDSVFEYSSEGIGAEIGPEIGSDVLLSVSGMLVSGRLSMSIGFSKEAYHVKTIKRLSKSYRTNLEGLIEQLGAIGERRLTPSD
ncbi:non-ribosomal peptide synthase [Gracilaria domingensis]|nr:non-ribosomal peptide synthase [Gracilaria domingensis]